MIDDIRKALESYNGEWSEKNGIHEFKTTIAERKAFLSTKKLTYIAKFRIDDTAKLVKFTEMLIEKGSGLSMGSSDGEMTSGFGFKTETYNTMKGPREGNIEEQSNLFGKSYSYSFDYKEIRTKIEEITKNAGYEFTYQITALGL